MPNRSRAASRGAESSITPLAARRPRDYTVGMVWGLGLAAVLIAVAVAVGLRRDAPRRRPAAPDLSEVRRLAETGRVNDAVQLYRRLVGVGEDEAKIAVDRIIRGHPPRTPPPK